jgi:hypothetical protein
MTVLIFYLVEVAIEDSFSDEESAPLQPVSTEIAVKLYNKDLPTLDRSNFNFNNSYEDFLQTLYKVLTAKTKLSLEMIEVVDKCITWKWYTVAKSQAKSQPKFNAVETEDHYQQMQKDIHVTAEKNPTFRNMVMRIIVEITKEGMEDDTMTPIGRVVIIFNFIANLKCPTTRAVAALAGLPVYPFEKHHDELREFWKCVGHRTEMECWKPKEPPFHGNICIPLSAFHLDTWALAMESNSTTKFAPPSTPEFWTLKESKMPGRRGGKASSTTPEPSAISASSPAVVTNNIILDGTIFEAKSIYDAGIANANAQAQVPVILKRCASPITEYPANQWTHRALSDFLRYCTTKYNDEDYLGYGVLLSRERLGIDLYKAATVDSVKAEKLMDSLEDRVNIPSGTAQRWLDDFQEWYMMIKGSVFHESDEEDLY